MFSANLGWSYTRLSSGFSHAVPLSLSMRPLPWLMAQGSISWLSVGGEDTYHDEILVGGIPTPRATTFRYSNRGIGDSSLSVWADAAALARLVLEPQITSPPASAGAG